MAFIGLIICYKSRDEGILDLFNGRLKIFLYCSIFDNRLILLGNFIAKVWGGNYENKTQL